MAIPTSSTNVSALFVAVSQPEPIISDELRPLIEAILKFVLFPFATLGTVTNAINIRVFIQQGVYSDTNTICLFALAISDLLGCFILLPMAACDILKHIPRREALSVSCQNVAVLVNEFPHDSISHITSWITVYIAIERCLCVLIPFKIKSILRPIVAAIAMAIMYFINTSISIMLFWNMSISWEFMIEYNETVAMFTLTEFGDEFVKYHSFIFNTVLSTTAAIITAIATGLMLYKLNEYKKWRQRSAATANSSSEKGDDAVHGKSDTGQRNRDIEILKSVTMVTGLFVICLSMGVIPGFAYLFVPGFSVTGLNKNLENLLYYNKFMLDTINSSLNFFFYIRISSKYKAAFKEVFQKRSKQVQ